MRETGFQAALKVVALLGQAAVVGAHVACCRRTARGCLAGLHSALVLVPRLMVQAPVLALVLRQRQVEVPLGAPSDHPLLLALLAAALLLPHQRQLALSLAASQGQHHRCLHWQQQRHLLQHGIPPWHHAQMPSLVAGCCCQLRSAQPPAPGCPCPWCMACQQTGWPPLRLRSCHSLLVKVTWGASASRARCCRACMCRWWHWQHALAAGWLLLATRVRQVLAAAGLRAAGSWASWCPLHGAWRGSSRRARLSWGCCLLLPWG